MSKTTASTIACIHKALGDETRLRLVNLLVQLGELCVCDLEAALDVTQSKTSRHLRVLKEAGLVADRRSGAWIYYRVHDDLSETGRDAVQTLDKTYGQSREGKRDIARAKRVKRNC